MKLSALYTSEPFKRRLSKINLIMKLTTFFIIIPLLHLCATTVAQKITIKKSNETLGTIVRSIEAQTQYRFLFSDVESVDTRSSVNIINLDIKDAMDAILMGLDMDYKILGKTIVIKKSQRSLIRSLLDKLTAIDLTGRVVDEQNRPLVGAIIKVKGSQRIAKTNDQGSFTLLIIDEDETLVITYVGFSTIEIKVRDIKKPIQLNSVTSDLMEVNINTGYYSVNERELTGNIGKVSAEVIKKQPVSNVIMAIQNRVPGVEITQLTGYSEGGFSVKIRGQNSISSGNNPLYIVDGVIFSSDRLNTQSSNTPLQGASPLSTINPNNIQSVEILKDADATAIYGSRGANGVVLITTKRGEIGETKVHLNLNHGFSEVGHRMELLNTPQYISMRLEALQNDNQEISEFDFDVNGTWDKNKYTDWQEVFIGKKAPLTNITASISGGNKASKFIVNANYTKEGTVSPGDFGFSRGGLQNSITFGGTDSRLEATLTTNYTMSKNIFTSGNPVLNIMRAPNAPDAFDENGNLLWYYNGVNIAANPMSYTFNVNKALTNALIGNATLKYKIYNDLNITFSGGYTITKREEVNKLPNAARNPEFNPNSARRSTIFGNNENSSWIIEPQLNHKLILGDGQLTSLLGMSFQQSSVTYRAINASDFTSDDMMDNIISAANVRAIEDTFTKYKYAALFARVNYSLNSRYYFNLTGRRDASSRFGPGKQFANFGALGIGWIFSDEKLIKDHLPFLSYGKLRSSYGITGNDQISDYGFIQLFNIIGNYQGKSTLITSRIANPDYAWERNKKLEMALQLGFLSNRINLEVAYYRNRSSNLLVYTPLAPSVGSTNILANLNAVVQNYGSEFLLSFDVINQKRLQWKTDVNLTIPKNKLVEYPGLTSSINSTRFIIGQPLTIRRYYNTYVDPQTGNFTYEDVNGNGVQDDPDRYLYKNIGQMLYGGWHNTLTFKNITLDFLVSFNKLVGNSLLSGASELPGFFNSGTFSNQPAVLLERWQKVNDITSIPKFTQANYDFGIGASADSGRQGFSDNSFARLKNVSLSFDLPKHWLSKLFLQSAAINLQGQNIFTITKFKGLDPERPLYTALPPLRSISLGLNVTF